jgi:putative metallohydrolase (TIGR04338 family)
MTCTQQDAVYRAEHSVPRGREFSSPEEVEAFIEDLREDYERWERDFKDVLFVDVLVRKARRSVARTEGDGGVITMSDRQMCERVVLHEVAHVLANTRYGDCGHSPWYARVMLELVYTSMGPEAYRELYEAYGREGVDHRTDDSGGRSIVL